MRLTVYDISGREVATLVDGWREAGMHEVNFNASSLSSAIYLARLTAGDFTQRQKLVLLKSGEGSNVGEGCGLINSSLHGYVGYLNSTSISLSTRNLRRRRPGSIYNKIPRKGLTREKIYPIFTSRCCSPPGGGIDVKVGTTT